MEPRKSTRELAIELAVSHTTVWNRLKLLESLKRERKNFLNEFLKFEFFKANRTFKN